MQTQPLSSCPERHSCSTVVASCNPTSLCLANIRLAALASCRSLTLLPSCHKGAKPLSPLITTGVSVLM